MHAGCMDPVVLLDEVDKISSTKHGDEVQSVLVHLLDRTQNGAFQDEYFRGVDIDLSRVVWVLLLNDRSQLSKVLCDRVEFIDMETPTISDKVSIAESFIVPAALSNVGMSPDQVCFTRNALQSAVSIASNSEAGVRNLHRSIESVVRKLNLQRLLRGEAAGEQVKVTSTMYAEMTRGMSSAGDSIPSGMYL